MTKVTIIGQEPNKEKELKKIEFVSLVTVDGLESVNSIPKKWDRIILIRRNYTLDEKYDLMYAEGLFGDNNFRACILGHFNDGVV